MKIIILIFTLIFCSVTFAGHWFPVGKAGAKTTYSKKSECEQVESPDKCFKISGKDMRRYKVGLIDDLNNPKFTKQDIAVCTDLVSCQPLLEALNCLVHDENALALIAGDYSEVYCAVPNGLEQKDALVSDAAGIIAADAEDLQKATDKTTRAAKKTQRLADKDACVTAVNAGSTLNALDMKNCLQVLVKEVFESSIAPGDL